MIHLKSDSNRTGNKKQWAYIKKSREKFFCEELFPKAISTFGKFNLL